MDAIAQAYAAFCEEQFPLPSEEKVADLERRFGISFPPEYRRFLLEYNGGFFKTPLVQPPSEDCPNSYLDVMYGIGASHKSAELDEHQIALFDDNFPAQIVPIGYSATGHLYYILPHPDDNGLIGLKPPSESKFFFLADSIDEFFALLKANDG
jgi:hypothetical protein